MVTKLITSVFGTKHERDVKKIRPYVDQINTFFEEYNNLTDDQIKAKTDEFKERISSGETIDDIFSTYIY